MSAIARSPTKLPTTETCRSLVPGLPLLFHGVPWHTYVALVEDRDNYHIRMTYDRGSLEMMLPLYSHEGYAGLLGRLVEALCEYLKLRVIAGWSTTFRREDLERGLEPDRCFWIASVAAI